MNFLHDQLKTSRQLISGLLGRAQRESELQEVEPVPALRRRARPEAGTAAAMALQIDCPDPTAEDALRNRYIDRAQFFARQERWDELADMIRTADRSREATPGSMPIAELYAYGARADARRVRGA